MSNVVDLSKVKQKLRGRVGRQHPDLADKKTMTALDRIRKRGAQVRDKVESGKRVVESLTPTEEDFCRLIAAGYSIRSAGRESGLAEQLGTENMWETTQRAAIAMRINDLMEDKRNTLVNEGERLRIFIATRLEKEAEEAQEGSTRMKALEQLGKMPHVRAYEEQVNMTSPGSMNPDEIKQMIVDKLKKLQG